MTYENERTISEHQEDKMTTKETLDFNTDNKDTEIVKHFDGLFISSNADGS